MDIRDVAVGATAVRARRPGEVVGYDHADVHASPLDFGATAASTEPTNCTAMPSGNTTRARCTGGTGQVRAGILCVVKGEFENDHYGPRVGIGATSTVTCPGGGRGIDWWYEIG